MSPAHQCPIYILYAIRSRSTGIPASILWQRANSKPFLADKTANQQYFIQQEEQALVGYVLRLADNGYPFPVKFLQSLAVVIVRQRSSIFQARDSSLKIRPPGKNWPQGFYRRYPQLKVRRLRAIDWKRDDRQTEDKVRHWFAIIGREFADPAIVPENVYNMDETGVFLSVLNSLKVLVDKDDLRKHRRTAVKRTLVMAIECISADGRFLHTLIIWPAATHRSSWTTHATPGWHFACSKTGYTNTENRMSRRKCEILYWRSDGRKDCLTRILKKDSWRLGSEVLSEKARWRTIPGCAMYNERVCWSCIFIHR